MTVQFIAQTIHHQTELAVLCAIDALSQNYLQSRFWGKVMQGNTLIFWRYLTKNQLDPCSHFYRIPACDRHMHVAIAITALALCCPEERKISIFIDIFHK